MSNGLSGLFASALFQYSLKSGPSSTSSSAVGRILMAASKPLYIRRLSHKRKILGCSVLRRKYSRTIFFPVFKSSCPCFWVAAKQSVHGLRFWIRDEWFYQERVVCSCSASMYLDARRSYSNLDNCRRRREVPLSEGSQLFQGHPSFQFRSALESEEIPLRRQKQ